MLQCASVRPSRRSALKTPPHSALTDPLISGIAKGSEAYKLVGSYVNTPLNWYVI